jgi:hypothetical protein
VRYFACGIVEKDVVYINYGGHHKLLMVTQEDGVADESIISEYIDDRGTSRDHLRDAVATLYAGKYAFQ